MGAPLVATINRRFVAYVLDGLLLTFLVAILGAILSPVLSQYGGRDDRLTRMILDAAQAAISAGYFVLAWARNGASPGQQALGIKTLSYEDGALLTERQALIRWGWLYGPGAAYPLVAAGTSSSAAGAYIIALAAYQIYIWRTASRDPLRRGVHDKQSGSVVMGPPFGFGREPAQSA